MTYAYDQRIAAGPGLSFKDQLTHIEAIKVKAKVVYDEVIKDTYEPGKLVPMMKAVLHDWKTFKEVATLDKTKSTCDFATKATEELIKDLEMAGKGPDHRIYKPMRNAPSQGSWTSILNNFHQYWGLFSNAAVTITHAHKALDPAHKDPTDYGAATAIASRIADRLAGFLAETEDFNRKCKGYVAHVEKVATAIPEDMKKGGFDPAASKSQITRLTNIAKKAQQGDPIDAVCGLDNAIDTFRKAYASFVIKLANGDRTKQPLLQATFGHHMPLLSEGSGAYTLQWMKSFSNAWHPTMDDIRKLLPLVKESFEHTEIERAASTLDKGFHALHGATGDRLAAVKALAAEGAALRKAAEAGMTRAKTAGEAGFELIGHFHYGHVEPSDPAWKV